MNFDIELIGIKACLIASLYPFFICITQHFNLNKKIQYFSLFIFLATAFFLKSRLLCLSLVIVFLSNYKLYLKLKTLILLSILGIVLLLFLNIDSVIGRFFIWKIIITNLESVPLFGFGNDSFKFIYANWQSNYFEINHLWSKYHVVADSPSYAYNEILNCYIENGILAILFFGLIFLINILFLTKRIISFYRHILMSNIVILFFALFSFPLHNVLVLTIFVCNHIMLIPILFKPLREFCIFLCIILIASVIFHFYLNIKNKSDWTFAQSIPAQYKVDKINKYENCYISLSKNQYYLSDFCHYLISESLIDRALEVLLFSNNYFNQYDKYLLLGDCYLKKNDFVSAKLNYRKANLIIPNRLIPLGNLMTLSLLEKDTLSAKYFSNQIISQPIKIESLLGNKIKKDALIISQMKLGRE